MNEIVEVPFNGGCVSAVKQDDEIWVSPKRVCENLGIDWESQRKRLERSEWACAFMMEARDSIGRKQEQLFITLDTFLMWLAFNPAKHRHNLSFLHLAAKRVKRIVAKISG
jgi:prophage antirepressor-like protein